MALCSMHCWRGYRALCRHRNLMHPRLRRPPHPNQSNRSPLQPIHHRRRQRDGRSGSLGSWNFQEVATMRVKKRLLAVNFPALGMLLLLASSAYADDSASGKDTAVLDLGKIQVHGQAEIVKALQSIKIALKAPESSDPKLRDAIVCR